MPRGVPMRNDNRPVSRLELRAVRQQQHMAQVMAASSQAVVVEQIDTAAAGLSGGIGDVNDRADTIEARLAAAGIP